MRFVHAADVHLDSPMKGLSAYPGAPVDAVRGATRLALESLVDFCLAERVDLLVIAGDVFDGAWKDFHTGLYLVSQLTRLREADIPVVMIRGNHDAASVVTTGLRLPDGIHQLPHDQPDTVVLEHLGVAVHGQSFAARAVTENLAGGYPKPLPGFLNIGLLHTCLGGYADHESYAPCALEELASHGYDYWALGHIHERAVLHTEPYIVFSGNLQGRHARECGAKGATLVELVDGDLRLSEQTFDHVRWSRVRVDAGHVVDGDELLAHAEEALTAAIAAAGDRLIACRFEIHGVTAAHTAFMRQRDELDADLRGVAGGLGGEQVWVERVRWETEAPRVANATADDALGETLSVIRDAAASDAMLADLADELRPLAGKLPADVRLGPDGIDPTDPETLRRLLRQVERLLPSLLTEGAAA